LGAFLRLRRKNRAIRGSASLHSLR
jgi:hypothetical protein